MPEIHIQYLNTTSLNPYTNNARKHGKAQIRQIAESMREFGFLVPVLVDKANTIIAGHGRVEAAKLLGLPTVPVIKVEHLTDAQRRAYTLADNRLAEKSSWDMELLTVEFGELIQLDTSYDLTITGFEMPTIDLLLHNAEEQDPDEGDEILEVPEKPVTQPGDLWQLGEHLLYCGDSLSPASYQQLMQGQKADMVITDPPYNVPIDGHVGGKGKIKHEEFAMAVGEMSRAQFTVFLTNVFKLMAGNSRDGSIHMVFMDWRHMAELLEAGGTVYDDLKNICVWAKDKGGMGSLYRSQHELVGVFKHGTEPHINNVELGKHGRNRTNVWNYRGANTMRKGLKTDLTLHPTVKPVRMIADALLDCSHRDGLILDPFGGSGTTLIAAEKTRRHARLIELEPKYCDVTIRRWQELTGGQGVHMESGQTFQERIATKDTELLND